MKNSDARAILSGVQFSVLTIGKSLYPPSVVEFALNAVADSSEENIPLKKRIRKFRMATIAAKRLRVR